MTPRCSCGRPKTRRPGKGWRCMPCEAVYRRDWRARRKYPPDSAGVAELRRRYEEIRKRIDPDKPAPAEVSLFTEAA